MYKRGLVFIILFKICRSWLGTGHLIIARIAEQKLKAESPEVLNKAYQMLKPLQKFFPETENSLLEAAIGADLLAMEFDGFLAYYHYIDIPLSYKHDKPGDIKFNDSFAYNITYAYESGIKIIRNSLYPPQNTKGQVKYVKNGLLDSLMLRYILHMVGDIHQPLHSTMLYSKYLYSGTLKTGDAAGNLIPVNDVFNIQITNLHAFWDSALGLYPEKMDLPISDTDAAKIQNAVQTLIAEYPESRFSDLTKNTKIQDWVAESNQIADNFVYSDIDVFPEIRPRYISEGQRIAKERIALAGYRLANALVEIFKNPVQEAGML